jgi:hypothetical protein
MIYYLGEYDMYYDHSKVCFVAETIDQARTLLRSLYPKAKLESRDEDETETYKISAHEDFTITPIRLGEMIG